MTTDQFLKAQRIMEELEVEGKRTDKVTEAVDKMTYSIETSGRTDFPFTCPLTGISFLINSMELKEVYSKILSRQKEKIGDLKFEFNNI